MGFGGELSKDVEYWAYHRENTVKWFKFNKKTLPWVVSLAFVVPFFTYNAVKSVQVNIFLVFIFSRNLDCRRSSKRKESNQGLLYVIRYQ